MVDSFDKSQLPPRKSRQLLLFALAKACLARRLAHRTYVSCADLVFQILRHLISVVDFVQTPARFQVKLWCCYGVSSSVSDRELRQVMVIRDHHSPLAAAELRQLD